MLDYPDSAAVDVLSDVLSLLNPKHTHSATLFAGGDWSVQFPGYEGITFTTLAKGECWLCFDGQTAPVRLVAGDCYLLTDVLPYRLASDVRLPAIPVRTFFPDDVPRTVHVGETQETLLIGGRFDLSSGNASLLLDALPPMMHIRAGSPHAALIHIVLERMADEVSISEPGSVLIIEHLAHILLVQALRAYRSFGGEATIGWLGALSDPKIGAIMSLMHQEPARRWRLPELATHAGMSRSSFALRFKQVVGMSPLDYLLQWRIRVAARALRIPGNKIVSIALTAGYESESAFSHAFKRVMGCSPKHYRNLASGHSTRE